MNTKTFRPGEINLNKEKSAASVTDVFRFMILSSCRSEKENTRGVRGNFFPSSILLSVNNDEKWPLPRHKMGLFVVHLKEKLNKSNMLNDG